tara:strand:- start:3395 stop:3874 length:480 start_codon:yes stop_codon:yes gene_type:complete
MATGRVYTAMIDGVAATTAIEFFFIACPTDAVTFIEEICITQDTIEISEQLALSLWRTTTDSSAGGTANTPNPTEVGNPAYGGTVRTMVAAAASAKTTIIRRESQNILNGWLWKGTYDDPILILTPAAATAGRMSVGLINAPAASTTFSGFMRFREIGG